MSPTCPQASPPWKWKTLTDIAVFKQAASHASETMSTTPESSPANGHVSPVADNVAVAVKLLDPEQSDSDLSDVQAADVEVPSPESPNMPDSIVMHVPENDFEESSGRSDNDVSDDADFDMADSLASAHSNGGQNELAASDDSQLSSKRKARANQEEDYMRENPELYGLRRSV